ncbi:hypothetical protein ACFLW4_06310 [Chloroflexota bacterium]
MKVREMIRKEELSQLKGGRKRMWLEQNYDLIIRFHQEFGAEETQIAFNLKEVTLEQLLRQPIRKNRTQFTKDDRAIAQAEIANQGVRELKQEVKQLRTNFERFQETVGQQLIEKFFRPLLQKSLSLPLELELKKEKDPLDLRNFDLKACSKSVNNKRKIQRF